MTLFLCYYTLLVREEHEIITRKSVTKYFKHLRELLKILEIFWISKKPALNSIHLRYIIDSREIVKLSRKTRVQPGNFKRL